MRALVYTRPSTVELLSVDEPQPGEGETLLSVEAAGICGSELHGVKTPGFRTPPLVMGHEFVGTTPDGRRVAVNPLVACGDCVVCRRDLAQLCPERSILGIHRAGGFAERVAVPEALLHELPDGLGWTQAAMIEPLANAVHVRNLARDVGASRVGVVGAGTIGLVCLLVWQAEGVDVQISDLSPERRAVAGRLGADAVAELSGTFDVVVDAVGVAATRRQSVDLLRPGGSAVWLGLLDAEAGFDAQALVRTGKRILGSFAYNDNEFAEAVRLAGSVPLDWVDTFPLSDGERIFSELLAGRTDIVKALLFPQEG